MKIIKFYQDNITLVIVINDHILFYIFIQHSLKNIKKYFLRKTLVILLLRLDKFNITL